MDGHSVSVRFKELRSNLVDLPSPLCNLLYNANIHIQDVVVEMVWGNHRAYAGWLGMTATALDTVDVDPIFAQALGVAQHAKVVLNLKLDAFATALVSLEPVTLSDWELVELHAQILEDKLLSQTRCVLRGQTLVVYPTLTTSARLVVTDIGTDAAFARLARDCEVAIAPKVRRKAAKPRDAREAHADVPSVLRRGVAMPHPWFDEVDGYAVVVGARDDAVEGEFVAVSVVPGPLLRPPAAATAAAAAAAAAAATTEAAPKKSKSSPPKSTSAAEATRVIARVVRATLTAGLASTAGLAPAVGLSHALAVALGCEHQTGNIVVLQPAATALSKSPAIQVHPYVTQTKKATSVTLNLAAKQHTQAAAHSIGQYLAQLGPLTNHAKLPIMPQLPCGGVLRFRRHDDDAWAQGAAKVELAEEVLRPQSFIERAAEPLEPAQPAVGRDIDDLVASIAAAPNSGTLVHGSAGSGKTLVLRHVAHRLNATHGFHAKYVACELLMNENYSLLTAHMSAWLQEALWHKPLVLVLDNVDKLLSAEQEHTDATQANQLTEYLVLHLARIHLQRSSNVSVVMSAAAKEAISKLLTQAHVIGRFEHLAAPDKPTRTQIIEQYLVAGLGCRVEFDLLDIVSESEGYLPNDLKVLCDRIYHEALFESDEAVVTRPAFERALQGYTPLNLRGVKLQKSLVNWGDIGGLREAKDIMLETLEWPTKYAPIFANCPLRLRSGILLYGYPGCGKTLLASAIAGQCGLNFILIKGPEILNKYIGASEQSVRELFERAQAAKPCILFFDEFDSIAPKRGHDSTGVTDRVVNQMLTQMDGAEGLDGVYVLAATSRPDLIDSALLRPGRLDKSVLCDMPSYADRLDILQTITKKMDLQDDVDLEELARATTGFSGADMQGLGYNAYLKAVHVKLDNDERLAAQQQPDDNDANHVNFFQANAEADAKLRPAERAELLQQIKSFMKPDQEPKSGGGDAASSVVVTISHKDFEESLEETKPSISASEMRKLSAIYRQFVSGRDGNMPDGTPSSEIGGRTTLM